MRARSCGARARRFRAASRGSSARSGVAAAPARRRQGAAQGDPQRLRRGAGAKVRAAQRAQRDRPPARTRPALRQAAAAPGVGARGPHPRARPAAPARPRARAHVSRRRRLAARRHGRDADADAARRQRQPEAHARVDEPVRVDARDRPPHPAQREVLVLGRDGAALDRGRHARSRTAVSEDHRLPRPRHARRRDRTRPRPPTARRRRSHPDQGGRYRPQRLTVTPGAPPRNSTASGTSSKARPTATTKGRGSLYLVKLRSPIGALLLVLLTLGLYYFYWFHKVNEEAAILNDDESAMP